MENNQHRLGLAFSLQRDLPETASVGIGFPRTDCYRHLRQKSPCRFGRYGMAKRTGGPDFIQHPRKAYR